MEKPGRRIIRIPYCIIDLLIKNLYPGLPKDLKVIDSQSFMWDDELCLKIQSEYFSKTPEAEIIPDITIHQITDSQKVFKLLQGGSNGKEEKTKEGQQEENEQGRDEGKGSGG